MPGPILPFLAVAVLATAPCPTHAAHVDTSVASARDVEVLGDDFGQTFVARDSFLTRVVLWQPDSAYTDGGQATLLIYDADSLGTPRLRQPILTGPSMPIPSLASTAKVPLVFNCVPALKLPHLGWFEVAFLAPCGARLWMQYSLADVLPDGHFWWNRAARCPPWSQSYSDPSQDLLVDIETCDHDPTAPPSPAVNSTWGRLKTAYR